MTRIIGLALLFALAKPDAAAAKIKGKVWESPDFKAATAEGKMGLNCGSPYWEPSGDGGWRTGTVQVICDVINPPADMVARAKKNSRNIDMGSDIGERLAAELVANNSRQLSNSMPALYEFSGSAKHLPVVQSQDGAPAVPRAHRAYSNQYTTSV